MAVAYMRPITIMLVHTLFFPNFVLEVDDSHANLLNYASLGPQYHGCIDYIEPQQGPAISHADIHSGRPATQLPSPTSLLHIIPPDTDDNSTTVPPILSLNDDSISSLDSSVTSQTHQSTTLSPLSKIAVSDNKLATNSLQPLTP